MKRLLGLLIVLVLVAVASPMLVTAAGATVPFKVRCVAYPEIIGEGPSYIVAAIPADCVGTHLGDSEWFSEVTAFMDSENPFVNPAPQYGDMVFTAADGSQLIGDFVGENVLNEVGGFDFWGTYQIVEGTGRFSGAAGSGIYYGGGGDSAALRFEGQLINP
jgi:hypothetical protein